MMKFLFSRIKKDMILNALIVLVLGAILLFYPTAATALVCYVLGALLLVYGGITMHQYLSDPYRSAARLAASLTLIVLGAFVLFRYRTVVSIIPFLMGIFFLFCGIRETTCALSLKDTGYSGWQVNLTLALIMSVAGVLLIFNPFTAAAFAVRFIGIMLIYDAVSQLWNIHCLSSHARGFFK